MPGQKRDFQIIWKFKTENLASSCTTVNSFSTENIFSSLWLTKVNHIVSHCFLVIKIHQIEKNGVDETVLVRSYGRALSK